MDTNKNDVQIPVVTKDQLQNEFDYMVAQQILQNLLEKGLISLGEFNKISALNLAKFSPELASIMS
ncbi:MAG: hypothetical protein RR788_00345 [Erysipelotrichaceae bacterium]